MGVLDRFEKGVENAMQSAFAKTFKSGVKPVELAAAVKRECDARAAAVDRNRTVAPNEYIISLATADYETVLRLNPASGDTLGLLGMVFYEKKQYTRAIASFTKRA